MRPTHYLAEVWRPDTPAIGYVGVARNAHTKRDTDKAVRDKRRVER